jgi:uncharacterized membrane protein YhiD involved in acid resistance
MKETINSFTNFDDLSVGILLLNLLIGFMLAWCVSFHYKKYSSVLSNKESFSAVLPFIILTTILVISVVKSSLALSLGLVGALSIVRFRTPIKEPEELAYLFISIAIGLGLGASQTISTIAASVLILILMAFVKRNNKRENPTTYFLSIESQGGESELYTISDIVSQHSNNADLRRYDITDGKSNIVFYLNIKDIENIKVITEKLISNIPEISITFIDQSKMPSI